MGSEKGPLTTVLLLHAEILGQSNNPPILFRLINFIYWLKQKNTPSGGKFHNTKFSLKFMAIQFQIMLFKLFFKGNYPSCSVQIQM